MIFQQEIDTFKKLIPDCDVIFDVGCRDDKIFEQINPKAEIHYFDPNISNVHKDKENYNNYALGSQEYGSAMFYYKYGSFLHRTEEPKFKDRHQSVIKTIRRLDRYCIEKDIKHIDYLKIDTEGWDFEVILGAGDMLNKTKYIQFEGFHYYANDKSVTDIFKFLAPRRIYEIGGDLMNYLATYEDINFLKELIYED